ncbi:hypothetical protein IEQ34_022278 [Dendrobium chrysotoxum]|uniref:Uncharacterized protein n=1 Tax=Dendrobium chrysotoxum TaxID=161865 RepID=A0AAV7FYL3_DENCH|nr:hypothetical protein IEQ34_022278 [Dendrobium chrysotoxum]
MVIAFHNVLYYILIYGNSVLVNQLSHDNANLVQKILVERNSHQENLFNDPYYIVNDGNEPVVPWEVSNAGDDSSDRNSNAFKKNSSTQIAGKLIFSLDRNLIVEGITSGNFIQFEMQFQDFKLSVDGEEMIDMSAGIQREVPLVEITLGSGVDSPIYEMEVAVTPLPTVSSAEDDYN